jgi:ubiquitin carboxyl-terminal hydrolase 10
MMPGVPPANSMGPNRRQNEYQYAYPPQMQLPYYHPQQYHPQHHAPQYAQQWYPQYPQQYAQPPRPYQPIPPPMAPQQHQQQQQQHHAPLIVSSHPLPQPFYPANVARRNISTPSVESTQTPPQAVSVPAIAAPLQRESPALSTRSTAVSTPPPSSSASQPSTAAEIPSPSHSPPPEEVYSPFQPPVGPSKACSIAPVSNVYQLPWLSVPDSPFPPKAHRKRGPKRVRQAQDEGLIMLPSRAQEVLAPEALAPETGDSKDAGESMEEQTTESQASTVAAPSDQETPLTSQAPSEVGSGELPTTPSSASRPGSSPTHTRSATRPAVPIIPATPKVAVPISKKPSGASPRSSTEKEGETEASSAATPPKSDTTSSSLTLVPSPEQSPASTIDTTETETTPQKPAAPKSWADLVRTKSAKTETISSPANGIVKTDVHESKAGPLAEAIRAFSVDSSHKISFLKPRGLVNSGNMCYMNSVCFPSNLLVFANYWSRFCKYWRFAPLFMSFLT